MAALTTPPVTKGWKAADFLLPATDGNSYSPNDICGENGLVVMFISNHCPFVKGILHKLVEEMAALKAHGINSIAIMSNDVEAYPEDDFAHMRDVAEKMQFSFPYVWDETQEVAKAYDAVCTPDFFGFDKDLKLQYRGRFDASRFEQKENAERDLFNAMVQIAKTGTAPEEQWHSKGCSIKWK
ncbi:MAG: thioredoxin family protein [Alphaproteobacteria bacterium]|nr:thioredoxin family protein [Alphaproteobacteria bacterium]